MNNLILENINAKAPYQVMQMEDFPHLFYFHTEFGVDYEISIKPNDAFIRSGATEDGKQSFRDRLFVRWFNTYEHHDIFFIKTAEGKMDGQLNFLAIISRNDNPRLQQAIKEFEETIAFLFD